MLRSVLVATVLLPAAGILAACSGGDEGSSVPAGSSQPPASTARLSLQAKDAYFEPADLTATFGQGAEVTVKNAGKLPHTFTIDELRVDQEIAPGKTVTLKLSPAEPGEFNFYCRFHVGSGMRGSIRVLTAAGGSTPATSPASPTGSPRPPSGYY